MAKPTSDAAFAQDVLQNEKPVLVDFWAEWCGPCRQLSPIVDQIDEENDDIEVFKVNIDENPETPAKHGVRGIPTLILFKGGQPVATKVGAAPKSTLNDWISEQLG